MRKRKGKATPIRSLIAKADREFSKYIRMRDADEGGTVSCVSCGSLHHWRDVHAGHWIKRQHQAVRFDERNVAAQCVRCNLHMGGCQDEFGAYVLRKYGEAAFNELLRLKRTAKKWTRGEVEELIEHYKAAAREQEIRVSPVCGA